MTLVSIILIDDRQILPPYRRNCTPPVSARSLMGWFLWLGLGLAGQLQADTEILVLQSHDSPPYQQALEGFKGHLAANNIQADYQIRLLGGNADELDLNKQLHSRPANLVLTLGTPATRAALAQVQGAPIVAGLVLDTDELRTHSNATGVGMNFSADLQWLWLRRLLPDAQTIAVIFDPAHGTELFQALQQRARNDGITLIPTTLSRAEDFPALL
ncbi:MAG: ABC transporter substrate binding protein, partial [Methylomonas sp.]|nr:ABC transporter substrate binding protein [Methylomonas sp.]